MSSETIVLKLEDPEIASVPPPDDDDDVDDGKKKYAPKTCYIVGDPYSLGTVCEDPGNKYKSYDCTASAAAARTSRLSADEISYYAALDADALLKKGLIDQEDLAYFTEFTRKALQERNKSLPLR